MSPIISVLLPVYNGEKFLKEAIESVLNQSFDDFELVIIDDGSTDDSCNIIFSYQDARIRFLRNEQNIGLIKTLNKGINESKGKYIARMDADDICREDRFVKQVEFLEQHPSYGIVGSWCSIINSSKKIEYHTSHESLQFALLNYCCFVHPSVMIRKSVLTEYQLYFDSQYVHSEDYELWTRLLTKTKAANLPEYLLSYREHENQISSKYREAQLAMVSIIRVNYLKKIDPEIPANLIELFSYEDFCQFDITKQLLEIDNFYNYFKDKEIFSHEVLIRNLLSRYKLLFFQIKKISINDYFKVVKSTLYSHLKLTMKQRIRFVIRIIQ